MSKRIDALEARKDPRFIVIDQFPGMCRDDALMLRFGDKDPPRHAHLLFIVDAFPPAGIPYDWAQEAGTPEYYHHWQELRAHYMHIDEIGK